MALRRTLLGCLVSSKNGRSRARPSNVFFSNDWTRNEWYWEKRDSLSTDAMRRLDNGNDHHVTTLAAASAAKDNGGASTSSTTLANSRRIQLEEVWMRNYEKVKEILDKYGRSESDLPRFDLSGDDDKDKLVSWLDQQRFFYRKKHQGCPTSLTDEREKKLIALNIAMKPWDRHWINRYKKLTAFVEERGCFPHECARESLNQDEMRLVAWCSKQRQQYQIYKQPKDGQFTSMTPEREQKLTAINFRFDLFAEIWMERYNELKAYRKHHGDCLVPHTFASNPQLGIWVGEQRYNSRTFKERRACAMTPERLALLEKLDFVWFVPDVIWNERYGELEEHVRFNGRGSLPTLKDNTRLRHWVANQQKLHRKIMNGEENALTEDRIRKLNKLGHLL